MNLLQINPSAIASYQSGLKAVVKITLTFQKQRQMPLAQILKRWFVQLFQVAHAAARQLDQAAGLCIGLG